MTCRHAKDDPNCSGYKGRIAAAKKLLATAARRGHVTTEELLDRTPHPSRYAITKHEQVGLHLVLEVQYSGCKKCSFDSRKVMVFLHTDVSAALYWTSIDPHFAERVPDDHAQIIERGQAPAPRARFPADDEGWADAVAYAKSKLYEDK